MRVPSTQSGSRNRDGYRFALLLLLLSVTGVTCASAEQLDRVTLQLKWSHGAQFAGYYAAKEGGLYREAGLEVTFRERSGPQNVVAEVLTGGAEYGVWHSELMAARARGDPVVVLAAIFQHTPLVFLARKGSGIATPQDMAGKRVMLPEGGNTAVEEIAVLRSEGVSLDAIERLPHSYDLEDLISGRTDVYAGYITNAPYELERKGVDFVTIRPQTYGIDFYGDCLFTTEQELERHPKRVARFLEASLRGWEHALAHPQETLELIATTYAPEADRDALRYEFQAMRPLIRADIVQVGHMNPGRWRHIADTFVSLGVIDSAPDLDGFIFQPPGQRTRAWLVYTAVVLSVLLGLVGAANGLLFAHDRALSRALERRTAELQKANAILNAEIQRRKEAQDRLTQSRQVFQKVADFTSDWEYWLAPDGALSYVSPSCFELTGHTQQEFMDEPGLLVQMCHAGDRAAFSRHLEEAPDLHGVFAMDLRIRTPDGDTKWVAHRCRDVRTKRGGYEGRRASNREISERVAAEEALRASERKYRTLARNIPDCMVGIFDESLRLVLAEGSELAKLEVSPEELEGRTFAEVLPPETASLVEAPCRQALTGDRARLEFVLDGSSYMLVTAPLLNKYGQVEGGIAVAENITPLRRAEQERVALLERVRRAQKFESLGTVAGGVAHHFNNMLHTILGFAELAIQDARPESALCEYVKEIETAANRAAEISMQMLACSGHGALRMDRLDLGRLVEEMAPLLTTAVRENVELRLRPAEPVPAIDADARQVRQLLTNLVLNASEATEGKEDGLREITVAVEREWHPAAFFQDSVAAEEMQGGDYVALTVTDTGCGMDTETMSRAFDPFFSTKFTGRGLGLAAVLGIVQAHNGAVKMASALGEGTRVSVYFPAVESVPDATHDEEEAERRYSGTVLVVDDEEDVRVVTKAMLESFGLTVLEAENGTAALDVFEKRAEDIVCVMLDVQMPGMRAPEVHDRMKRRRPGVPIAVATAYPSWRVEELFGSRDVAALIQKPYRRPALSRILEQILTGAEECD